MKYIFIQFIIMTVVFASCGGPDKNATSPFGGLGAVSINDRYTLEELPQMHKVRATLIEKHVMPFQRKTIEHSADRTNACFVLVLEKKDGKKVAIYDFAPLIKPFNRIIALNEGESYVFPDCINSGD